MTVNLPLSGTVCYNRHHKVSHSSCHKIVAILLRIWVRGTLCDTYTMGQESHCVLVINNSAHPLNTADPSLSEMSCC